MNLRDEFDTIQNQTRRIAAAIASVAAFVAACSMLFYSQSLKAASNIIEVPAVLTLPVGKADLDATLAKYLGETFAAGYTINQALADVVVRDPFEIRLSGVRITGNIRGRTETDSRGVLGEAVLRHLKISVERISIHTVIRSTVGGVDARIRLDAECASTVVDWKSIEVPLFLRAKIVVGPTQPFLDIEGLTLSTLFEKPEILMNCTGPAGVDAVLREQAWTALIERWTDSAFLEEVQSAIESTINVGLRPGGEGISFSPQDNMDVRLRMKATSYKVDARGAHLLGLLRFDLDRPMQETPRAQDPEKLIPENVARSLTLSVATDAVEALLQSYFAPGVWSHWMQGRDIEGFRDLMSSRFSQLFAFPALMDFPKDAPMAFATSLTNRLNLNCTDQGRLQLTAPIGSWLVLQDSSQLGFKPLVHFSMPITLNVSKLNSAKPTVSLQQLSLSSEFHQKYVEDDRPNTTIAHDTILERLRPAVESEIESFLETSQVIQTARGLIMDCEPASQIMRFTAP